MAVGGWRRGVIVSALSLTGFVAGAIVGTRLASWVVSRGSESPYTPLFGLIGALLIGAIFSASLEILGFTLRRVVSRIPGAGTVDGTLGAGFGVALALGIAWLAGAVALQTPGLDTLRADIQRSHVLRRLNDALPPSGSLLHALARFDPFPSINGPEAEVPAPPSGIGRKPAIRAAAASVVRVTGTACGLGIEGSGWVAAPHVVVTNAHVIAGEDDTRVQVRGGGERLHATPVAFDPKNDIAVLRVDDLPGDTPALPLRDNPPSGAAGAILGFPRNGPYDVRSARLGSTTDVLASDAYGRGPLRRAISSFRGLVRPGNSGGPVVDTKGRVLTTVFATAHGRGHRHQGYGVPNSVVQKELAAASSPVSSGPCAP